MVKYSPDDKLFGIPHQFYKNIRWTSMPFSVRLGSKGLTKKKYGTT